MIMPDYLTLDTEALQANEQIAERNYWKYRMQGFEPVAYLDARVMTGLAKQLPASCTVQIPQEISDALQAMSASPTATQVILLSAVAAFLQKVSGQPEVLVYTPQYGSKNIQVIPVRIGFDDNQDLRHFILRVKEDILNDFSYGHFPVRKIHEMLPGIEGVAHQVGMMMKGIQESVFEQWNPGLLFVFDLAGNLEIELQYDSSHFDDAYISYTGQLFVHFLGKLLRNRETPLSQLALMDESDLASVVNMFPAKEMQQVISDFNQTTVPYPNDGNIISLFEEQVNKTPGNNAIRFGDFTLTYKELDDLSGQFAAYLKTVKKVNHGDLIGVMLEREEYLIPTIYGILKAGCAYIPVDPYFPAERIQNILDDSGTQWMITRGKHISSSIEFSGWIDLENSLSEIREQQKGRSTISGNDLAYIIYTSGSTGKPKGVMIEHHSVVNRLLWMQKRYPVGETDVLMQKTPVVFDVSVWELFWWSFTGASLYLLPPGGEKEPALIAEVIEKQGITTMHFVPSMLGVFLASIQSHFNLTIFKSLRLVVTSGEALQTSQVEMFDKTLWRWNQSRLINLYGPTEATVDVSYYECDFAQVVPASIPIGKPIDNIHLYIINKWGCPVPLGVSGELCIAGVGLARGYINNAKLTSDKFINVRVLHGERIYKTGDLAKWLPDGNIMFLGRIDTQVKLRGFRIEPGEIEYRLSRYEGISHCVVLPKERHGEPYLVGYYVSPQPIAIESLQNFLAASLPEYMIPAFFVHLHILPLSVNGKLDRKALPDPQLAKGPHYEAPITPTEKQLAEIWSKVLHLDLSIISVNRSFFEMGGHSMLAMAVVNKIPRILYVTVPLKDFITHNTIRSLANYIDMQAWLSREEKQDATGKTEVII
jgi:amino acid adenylation domain-containing protein